MTRAFKVDCAHSDADVLCGCGIMEKSLNLAVGRLEKHAVHAHSVQQPPNGGAVPGCALHQVFSVDDDGSSPGVHTGACLRGFCSCQRSFSVLNL